MTVVGRVVAAGIVAVGSMMFGGSAHAAVTVGSGASGQITSPSDGQVVSGSSVTISARTGLMQLRMGLYVDGPSTGSVKVAGGGANQTISGTFDAGSAPNGTFTVTLKGEITGTRYDSSTFKLRRPAETPSNVSADLQGTTKVVVTWSKGAEPDLQTYQVSNTQSGVVGRLAADNACSGGSCKAVLAVPAKAAGQKVGFTVRAFRSDGDGGSVGSGESGTAYVSVPAPPAAQPKKEVNKTRQAPKTSERVDPLPTLPAKKQTQPTRKATAHRPKVTAKVPAIPDTDTKGNLPIPTADERQGEGEKDGLTPSGGNGEGRSDQGEGGSDTASVQVNGVKAQSGESVLGDVGQYGLYVAGGLLLLLLGAHAGAWARRRALAAEGGRGGSSQALRTGPAPTARGTSAASASAPASRAAAGAGVSWTGTEVGLSGAGASRDEGGEGAAGVTPRRRPAVILAVAKTRMPQGPQAADGQASASGGASSNGDSSPMPAGWQGAGAGGGAALPGGGQGLRQVSAMPGLEAGGANIASVADAAPARGVLPVDAGSAHLVPPAVGRPDVQGDQGYKGVQSHGGGQRHGGDLSKGGPGYGYAGGQGREGGAADHGGRGGRQEPVRIALPSSAVIEVPEPAAAAAQRPAVRIEERWDDYLPPSPRSMEDSGFWERPQPGALDFWAPDDEGAEAGTSLGAGGAGTIHAGGAGAAIHAGGAGGAVTGGPGGAAGAVTGGSGVGGDAARGSAGSGAGGAVDGGGAVDRPAGAGGGASGSGGVGTSAYAGRRHEGGLS
ncbi:hypothetical protein SMD20_28765 [Nonomuraea sp. LP-02]|uniref:hypothetical protein n=1 Tax=Nonomuraea sp. LP-02 TaxID=3097960 RepID=UPI002E37DA7D|nr:hypothetical protein [Nonomuraea sp. LP-02]MED7928281.1 hypothetical protein [Nonomuraea sp. LP-02]